MVLKIYEFSEFLSLINSSDNSISCTGKMKLCDKYKTGKGYRKRIQEIYLRHVEGKIINIFENLFVSMTEYTILITNFSKIKKEKKFARCSLGN